MCGIAGFVNTEEAPDVREREFVLERMCYAIRHRGPDDQGTLIAENVAFGMRRLSIIDLAGGHQPMANKAGTVSLVFNGEIYNYRELQRELTSRGHEFQTNSDTEAIVHAYDEYGNACVEHLRGMFAFAIWNSRLKELMLARDRVGKKPLYYTLTSNGTLIFGSELKSLLEHPEVTRDISPEALDAYLTFGYVPDPLCILRGINKLPPGHFLTFRDGIVSLSQYWDFRFSTEEDTGDRRAEDYLDELRELLNEAVRIRLISDVPLGAFLSGGIDSSAVVGLMARNSDRPVKTFSIGFNEDSYDELKYARIAAAHFGTEHHEFIVTPDICQLVDELAWHFDEPFADPSALPTYMVSKLAREHVTVALSGDGGDELFAGYTRYLVEGQRAPFEKVPRVLRQNLMRSLSQRLPHRAWGRNYLHNISLDGVDRFLDSVSVFTQLTKRSLYTSDFRSQLKNDHQAGAHFQSLAKQGQTSNPLDMLLYLDSKTYLPGDILTKVDRMSMAVSVEARAPLLDHKLIEFVTRIPASLKLHDGETKYIFKRAIEDFVPFEILHRSKQGFGLPIQQWINEQLREQVRSALTDTRARARGYVEQDYVAQLLAEHERGRRDHSAQLWALFMLELWHRVFIDDSGANVDIRAERLPLAVS